MDIRKITDLLIEVKEQFCDYGNIKRDIMILQEIISNDNFEKFTDSDIKNHIFAILDDEISKNL